MLLAGAALGSRLARVVYALRAQTALRLARHLSLLAGVGLNVAVGWSGRDADVGLGVLESVWHSGRHHRAHLPGLRARRADLTNRGA